MFKNSFFYPDSLEKAILLVLILLMIPLRQSEIFGLMDSTALVFGWVPAQIAYDFLYVTAGTLLVVYIVAKHASRVPESIRELDRLEEREGNR